MASTPGAPTLESPIEAVQAPMSSSASKRDEVSSTIADSYLPGQQGNAKTVASPHLLSTSMTPPPSSQPRATRPSMARTPTPQTPHLSSPPPTLKYPAQLESLNLIADIGLPSTERVENADTDELRSMVHDLCVALRESRLSTAHHKLQLSMLSIESQETQNRMAVELGMAQREVEVFQDAETKRRMESIDPNGQDVGVANATLLHEMSRHCSLLQQDNEELQDRLAQSQRVAEVREARIIGLLDKNDQLRERIRANRQHVNGLLDYVHENSPQSLTTTPRNQAARIRHYLPLGTPTPSSKQRSAFEDLLLADRVLSARDSPTMPVTPTRGRRLGHRAVQSMSSLPSTPQRIRPGTANTNFQTPPTFRGVQEPPRTVPAAIYTSHRRRPSSDSTVTASSVDEEVPESRASQAATSMLRRTPKSAAPSQNSSFASRAATAAAAESQGKQKPIKLFGAIGKAAGADGSGGGGGGVALPADQQPKRRLSEHYSAHAASHGSPPKKAKRGEVVGLGIGVSVDRRA